MNGIKVLVVDDDKLVRKGLISAMPWAKFGMDVVGEAANGEKALEYIKENAVDLLLTDLAMPVMSGIELMREVRKRYPHIHIVVLTLHQDFDYVQEALRLGAIDYIAKVQLEKEHFDQVLARIADRIRERGVTTAPTDSLQGRENRLAMERGYALAAPKQAVALEDTELWPSLQNGVLSEVGINTYLWLPNDEHVDTEWVTHWGKGTKDSQAWSLLELTGLQGLTRKDVHAWVQQYRERDFFYDYAPGFHGSVRVVTAGDEPRHSKENAAATSKTEESLSMLKAAWSSHDWVRHDNVFAQLTDGLKQLRLPEAKLIGLLYSLIGEWNRLFEPIGLAPIALPEVLDCWQETVGWLSETRESIRRALNQTAYSQEVVEAVMKAKQLAHEELGGPVTAADLARRVNMSRGYFSQCFKDLIGRTFNDYLRHIRIEKAKELLLYTHKPIHWIAEQTGYADEKYFSRTFREHTGILPSEFRQTHRDGQETGRASSSE
jgi:two-component system, response regulator YesN